MKNTLFILLLFILSSCSASRKMESKSSSSAKLDEKSDVRKSAIIVDKSETKRDYAASRTQAQSDTTRSNTSIKIVDYDTSKPSDPATGRPPVLRETQINNTTSSAHQSQSDEKSTASANKKSDISQTNSLHSKQHAKAAYSAAQQYESRTSTGVRWWVWAVGAMLVLVVIGLIRHFVFHNNV